MACSCRGAARAGSKTKSGKTVIGYLVEYAASLNRAPETYLSRAEARAALTAVGGKGTITTKVG